MPKITKTTIKSFVKKNAEKLHINICASFNGMFDGMESHNNGFSPAERVEDRFICYRNLGFKGIVFTNSTRNWCEAYEDENFTGYRIDNCVASFILAIPK